MLTLNVHIISNSVQPSWNFWSFVDNFSITMSSNSAKESFPSWFLSANSNISSISESATGTGKFLMMKAKSSLFNACFSSLQIMMAGLHCYRIYSSFFNKICDCLPVFLGLEILWEGVCATHHLNGKVLIGQERESYPKHKTSGTLNMFCRNKSSSVPPFLEKPTSQNRVTINDFKLSYLICLKRSKTSLQNSGK